MEAVGCRVLAAKDGQDAWEIRGRHAGEVDMVATDVEKDTARSMAAGVDEYQIKLNKGELMESIRKAVGRKTTDDAAT